MLRVLVAIAMLAVVAACGETPSQVSPFAQGYKPPPLPTPTPVGIQTPPSSDAIYAGAWVQGTKGILGLEASINRKLAIDADYQPWVARLPSNEANEDLRYGRIYFASWDCGIGNSQVASGFDDALIVSIAQAVKHYAHTVFLRYMWDPNMSPLYLQRQQCYDVATDNADGTFSAANYVAAYRHIHQLFAATGANNVVWVWSFNIDPSGQDPTPFYPGDDVVDWIGIDGYVTTASTIGDTFGAAYSAWTTHNKPMMFSEVGVAPAQQVGFFNLQAAPTIQQQFPQVKAFVYFDDQDVHGKDWSFSPAGLAKFTVFVNDPYLQGFPKSV